jgi:propanol-preferring alcohol dehydrogenase
VQVGLLSPKVTMDNFLAVRKHLSILCSYGGTMDDLKQCLKLIASGDLKPQLERGDLADFPKALEDLHEGRVKSRIALIPGK